MIAFHELQAGKLYIWKTKLTGRRLWYLPPGKDIAGDTRRFVINRHALDTSSPFMFLAWKWTSARHETNWRWVEILTGEDHGWIEMLVTDQVELWIP